MLATECSLSLDVFFVAEEGIARLMSEKVRNQRRNHELFGDGKAFLWRSEFAERQGRGGALVRLIC